MLEKCKIIFPVNTFKQTLFLDLQCLWFLICARDLRRQRAPTRDVAGEKDART